MSGAVCYNPHLRMELLKDGVIPYENGWFDAILLFAVLNCIPTNKGQEALIEEFRRILRPGGILYISDYFLQEDERNIRRYNQYASEYGIYGVFELPDHAVLRHHELSWIKTLTKEFQLAELNEINISTMNGNSAKAFQYIGRYGNDL
ncbi:MAG: class I SAM-dependent methyltransferase [Desulfobacteraceae bacterium]|nr:class I SAM-dependent methyltransferase [Desulfobacteraceae bacterium]